MNYANILAELLSKNSNPKLGLERISFLLKILDLSFLDTKIIQVIGTNGKGSTVAFTEAILRAHNYTTGLFTSPHLCCARERIRINNCMISEELFVKAYMHVNKITKILPDQPSFFEQIFAMAMYIFSKSNIDVVILEAGLGGRLDATTACDAHILGVSTIALDHQHILGNSIEQISVEKIAAARAGQKVISVEQEPKSKEVILQAQKEKGFDLEWAQECELNLGLYGDHQKINAGLALAIIAKLGIKTSRAKKIRGLLQVNWPGRFEIIRREVDIILDGAHNISGIKALSQAVINHSVFGARACVLVFGSLVGQTNEKISELLKNLNFCHIFLHCPNNSRAQSAQELKIIFIKYKININKLSFFSNWDQVINNARKNRAYILVCGSLYTVGEARSALLNISCDNTMPNF